MAKYKFLLKPLLFIFNLVFATWLVLAIEKISPSDFGQYEFLFEDSSPKPEKVKAIRKDFLKKLCTDYKMGRLDSTGLEKGLERFLTAPHQMP